MSHQSDCSGKVNCVYVITNSQLANFLAAKQKFGVWGRDYVPRCREGEEKEPGNEG